MKKELAFIFCAATCLPVTAQSAVVSAGYEGIIDSDSGLGLIGETLQIAFTYDDSVLPSTSYVGGNLNDSALYDNHMLSMTVTIGSNIWSWNTAADTSSIFLYNDALITFAIGTEDRVSNIASGFTGTELVPGAHSYSSYVWLSDNEAPLDGLTDGQTLPGVAPDANLFTRAEGNSLQFEFYSPVQYDPNDPNSIDPYGNYFLIETAGVNNISAVPVPAAAWLFASGLIGLAGFARRRNA